jgi:hypothetical protein
MNNFLIYSIMPERKKQKSRKQKIYKMKGCSKKKYLGGSDMNLAYTGKPIFSIPNPNLAYTGTSSKVGGTNSSNMRTNINAENSVYPNTGPLPKSEDWINSSTQRGGCGGDSCPLQNGGTRKHRTNCKCSNCKGQKGGNGLPFGQGLGPMKPILAPNGLTGSNWGANFSWPGTNNVGGDFNHYSLNKYAPVDISREMVSTGAQPPFLGGSRTKKSKNKGKGKSRKQRGGTLSNFMYQDLVNVGRQFQFGLGSTYNALRGYESPVNPMPWQQPGLSNPNVFK